MESAKPAAGKAVLSAQLSSLDLLLGERAREVGNLKETGSALLLWEYLLCRDLAHSRILKLDYFKKEGEISRDDIAIATLPHIYNLCVHVSTQPAVQVCVCLWGCLCLWMCLAHVPVSLSVQVCVSVLMCLLRLMWVFYMYRFTGMCFLFPDSVCLTLCRPRGVWVRTFHLCVCASHTHLLGHTCGCEKVYLHASV